MCSILRQRVCATSIGGGGGDGGGGGTVTGRCKFRGPFVRESDPGAGTVLDDANEEEACPGDPKADGTFITFPNGENYFKCVMRTKRFNFTLLLLLFAKFRPALFYNLTNAVRLYEILELLRTLFRFLNIL